MDAFATTTPKDTTAAPMTFSLDRINLDRVRVKFDDKISKNDLEASINHFDTRVTKFDLEKLDFEVPKVKLDGVKVVLKQGLVGEIAQNTQKVAEEASKQPDVKIKLEELDFTNIEVGYDNEGSHLASASMFRRNQSRAHDWSDCQTG